MAKKTIHHLRAVHFMYHYSHGTDSALLPCTTEWDAVTCPRCLKYRPSTKQETADAEKLAAHEALANGAPEE